MSTKDTSFSFHCMICYEGFDNSASRYPVVLPCGHTYVCNACGERIDRCMECRTPLYLTFDPSEGQPQPTNQQHHHHPELRSSPGGSWNRPGGRHVSRGAPGSGASPGVHQVPAPAPPKLIRKRIPLPKNVVLLSLIEATELATADVQFSTKSEDDSADETPPTPENRVDHKVIIQSMQSLDEEERNEEEKIHLATSLSVGVGGTYAVAAKEGLTIYPQRPNKRVQMEHQSSVGSGSGTGAESDVDNLVDDFQQRHQLDPQGSQLLDYGDRVQIVAVDKDGWAKLARGYGYVFADRHQIVKVGGAVDRACRLEAMLRIVSQERKRLRREQSKIDNSFIRLMNELQHSLDKDEDLTVICRSTFTELDTSQNGFENQAITDEKKENQETRPSMHGTAPPNMPTPPTTPSRASPSDSLPFYPPKPSRNEVDHHQKGASLICFSPEEFLQPTAITESFSMTDITASARELLRGSGGGSRGDIPALRSNMAYPSQSEMLAGARAWRERHGRPAATDFRTGMSGHSALLSSKPGHPHELLDSNESVRKPMSFRMSSHTGLTMARKQKPQDRAMPLRSGMWAGGNPRGPNPSASSPSTYADLGTP